MKETRSQEKRKVRTRIRTGIGIAIILLGCAIFLYPNFREWQTSRQVDLIVAEYSRETTEAINTSGSASEMPYAELYEQMQAYNESLLEGQSVADVWTETQQVFDFSTLETDDGLIGYIDIPDMSVRLPLYIGASKKNLAKGACVMYGTSMPIGGESTNCVIAGHRGYKGSAYFRYIDRVQQGSVITITTPWETLTYQVTGTKVVKPSDKEAVLIQDGKDMITLVSCHPYIIGGKRFLVYAERVNTENADSSTSYVTTTTTDTADMAVIETDAVSDLEGFLRVWLPIMLVAATAVILAVRNRKNRNSGTNGG